MSLTLPGEWGFLLVLGILWTWGGYMNGSQRKGITNILFYALMPCMLLAISQQTDTVPALTSAPFSGMFPEKLIPAALACMIAAPVISCLNRLPFFRKTPLLDEHFHVLYAEGFLAAGAVLSGLLFRLQITLPAVLASPLDMLYQTVVPVSMFLLGNVCAEALGLKKGGRA